MRKNIRYAAIGMAGLLSVLTTGVPVMGAEDVPAPQGQLEDFKLITSDGEERSTEIFEDVDVTIINIWGTYCGPCIQEMPELAEFEQGLPDRVQFMTMCIDAEGQEDAVASFLEQCGFEDPSHAIVAYGGDLADMVNGQVYYIPTTITIDSEGNILEPYIIGGTADVVETYTELANSALEQLELPLLGEEEEEAEEAVTESVTE